LYIDDGSWSSSVVVAGTTTYTGAIVITDQTTALSLGKYLADILGGSAGSGASAVTITWTCDGSAVADGDVWITSDAAGANVVAGTLQTNSMGKATFMLDAGSTYFLWAAKDSINSIKGERFVAVAD
jgi:hypothetical protein